MMILNQLKKNSFFPSALSCKTLDKGHRISKSFANELTKKGKTQTIKTSIKEVQQKKNNEILDFEKMENPEYKYSPYLKPLDIKGIKRADRKLDYNSSYNFMIAQKDYDPYLLKNSIFKKYLYSGMKVPLPPKKYKISEYVDVRLDMFAPFIISGIMSLPFLIAPCYCL